jgi:magnesium transporter
MSKWLTFKKELSLIYRLIFDATLSFELFITYHKKYSTFEELAYADVYEHIERIRDLSKVSLDKLDHLYDFYRAKVDEKMNHNVYYLTLLSGIFMPLTLISGFFGMNTGGLPFLNDSNGTLKVVLVAVVVELLIFIPFLFQNMHKTKKYTHKKDSFD